LNGGSRDGFRAQLLFKPNEDFNLRWIGDYNEEDSSAGTRVLYNTGPTINGVNLYQSRANAAGATLVNGSHRKVNLTMTNMSPCIRAARRWKPTGRCRATSR
jgi:iron complex outermembrane receptor protein